MKEIVRENCYFVREMSGNFEWTRMWQPCFYTDVNDCVAKKSTHCSRVFLVRGTLCSYVSVNFTRTEINDQVVKVFFVYPS